LRTQADIRRQRLLKEVRKAIDSDQLVLHYQPKIDLESGRVDSFEALLRWNHPKRGTVPPDEFLPETAGSDLIGPLTVHVIDKALRDCLAWRGSGIDAGVEVNLSVANVLDPQLPVEIERLLKKWELPAEVLGLELTEAAIAAARERAVEVLQRLSEMGVRLSIDDFGTGYSSLAVLRDLPVSEIKIDRTFVTALAENPSDQMLVRSIVGLAHQLDVRVVAEGVEDAHTLDRLTELGCDVGQGYYFSRPMPFEDLFGWLVQATGVSSGEGRSEPVPA
jgi:EAL domain-containing protein (putative c-di-GMP-specific phosphodiesterase class I)